MLFHFTTRAIISSVVLLLSLVVSQLSFGQPRQSKHAAFYTFSIERTGDGYRVAATDVQHMEGDFKIPDLGKVNGYDHGLLVIKVADASGNIVYETTHNNPLDEHIEGVGDHGELQRTHVPLDASTFNIRIPLNTKDYIISVYSVEPANRLALLATIR